MTKHCLIFCVLFLTVAAGCDHMKEKVDVLGRDDSDTSDTRTGCNSEAGGVPGKAIVAGERVIKGTAKAEEHVAFKPVSGNAAAIASTERKDSKPTPLLECLAMELAAKELAVNLRLLEENDAGKRAELEREMVSLREQRRSLYQTHVEGK